MGDPFRPEAVLLVLTTNRPVCENASHVDLGQFVAGGEAERRS